MLANGRRHSYPPPHMRLVWLLIGTIVALAAVGWFWVRSLRRDSDGAEPRRLFPMLVVFGVLCRLVFLVWTPIFYSPDEGPHIKYVQHLVTEHTFPVQAHKWADPAADWEFCQPPLYYLALAPVYQVAQALFHQPIPFTNSLRAAEMAVPDNAGNPAAPTGGEPAGGTLTRGPDGRLLLFAGYNVPVLAMRFCSVLLWLLNLWLAAILLRRLQITDTLVWSFVWGMVCLLPTYTVVSSVINNDNLLTTMGTGLLCLMAGRRSVKNALLLGVVLGLTLLTKQSGVVFVPAIVVLYLLEASRRRLNWSAAVAQLGIVLGLGFLLFLPWALRNWQVYGTFSPETFWVEKKVWSNLAAGLAAALHNILKSFWAGAGPGNEISYPFPLAGFAFLLLCMNWRESGAAPRNRAGTAPNAEAAPAPAPPRAPKPDFLHREANRPFLMASLVAVLVNLLLVLRFGYLLGMGQGRHLFPVLCPIALYLGARWRTFPAKKLEPYTAGIWVSYAVGFVVFALWCFWGFDYLGIG
jgi:4-amino-4-deoxy-L-arabinose transferase-like glycosyltransferase